MAETSDTSAVAEKKRQTAASWAGHLMRDLYGPRRGRPFTILSTVVMECAFGGIPCFLAKWFGVLARW